jgi:hypothetical protein
MADRHSSSAAVWASASSSASSPRRSTMQLVRLHICSFRGLKRPVYFGLRLSLPLLDARIAHRFVLGRVRLDLGAVARNVPELHKPGLNKLANVRTCATHVGSTALTTAPRVGDLEQGLGLLGN